MKKLLLSIVLAVLFFLPQMLCAQDSVMVTFAVNDAAKGTINPAPGTYTFAVGEEYSVTATACDGYQLMGWTIKFESSGEGNSRQLDTAVATLTATASVVEGHAAYTITAVFATTDVCADCFTLDLGVNHSYMGTLSLAPGIYHFGMGDQYIIMAYPNEGYEFVGWYTSFAHPSYGISQDEVMMTDINCIGPIDVNSDLIGAVSTIVAIFDGPELGVAEAEAFDFKVYGSEGRIFVGGAEGREVFIYDIYGRMLYHSCSANTTETYTVPASGVYLVEVAGVKTKQVVVVR